MVKKSLMFALLPLVSSCGTYLTVGSLVEIQSIKCESIDNQLAISTQRWRDFIPKFGPGVKVRDNWESQIKSAKEMRPGVILTITAPLEREIRYEAWLDIRGEIILDREWRSNSEKNVVFSELYGSDCSRYDSLESKYYFVDYERDRDDNSKLPPKELPHFLMLPVLKRVPRAFYYYLP